MHTEKLSEAQRVVGHHLAALLSGDTNEILRDYDSQSVVFTPDGPVAGLEALGELFSSFLGNLPPGSLDRLEVLSEDYVENYAYLLWCIDGIFPLGTDTFVIENGKIRMQSFAVSAVAE